MPLTAPPSPELLSSLLGLIDERVYILGVGPGGEPEFNWSSQSLDELTGYSPADVQRLGGWGGMLHPEDRAAAIDHYRQALSGQDASCEFRFVAPDGSQRWVRNRLHPVRDASGNVTRICGAARDLTQHTRTEAALRSGEKLLRDVLDALPIGVCFFNRDGVVVEVNEIGKRLGGLTAGVDVEALTRTLRPRPAPGVAPVERSMLDRALTDREVTVDREIEVDAPDGVVRTLRLSMMPLTNADGTVSGALCLTSDITEGKRMQAQLQQAARMESIGRMAGGIAHDFNNLLTIIIGSAEMGLMRDAHSVSRQDWEETLSAAKRAAELTRQLLAFARQQPIAPRVIDLNDVAGRMEGLLRRVLGAEVHLVVDRHADVLPVNVDRGQFEQILLNFAVNARDAMPGGGTLRVATGMHEVTPDEARVHPGLEPGSKAVLTVEDDGSGIPEQLRARVFEPFFTTKGPGRGTGLGLAMCYGIVKQAGGYIGVDSREGRGTRFWIYLPLASGPLALEAPTPSAGLPLRGAHVLLVEDEVAVAHLTRRALELGGYDVTVAGCGAEALAVLEAPGSPVHMLLTDIVMPDMHGTVLARRAVELVPGIRVMFVSGYAGSISDEFEDTFLLQKPFTPGELIRHVSRVLGEPLGR